MTEQGTPRAETLVMDQLNGRVANARLFNPYVPGVEINNGLKPLFPPLWEMDTMKGEQFPAVAAEPLKALNQDFTRFQIKVRPGSTGATASSSPSRTSPSRSGCW